MNLKSRVERLEQRVEAATPPSAALVLIPGCDEAAERARFEQIHGRPPALVIRCTVKDASVRQDPDEVRRVLTPEELDHAAPAQQRRLVAGDD